MANWHSDGESAGNIGAARRRGLGWGVIVALICPTVWGQTQEAEAVTPINNGYVSLGAGIRFDDFDWNIADSDGSPNVLSELHWNDMRTPFVAAAAEWEVSRLRVRVDGVFGKIASGDNVDSDYNGNNRTLEFSRSENEAGGEVAGLSGAVGYRFTLFDRSVMRPFYLTPWLGYGGQWQWLSMTEGYQVIPATGEFNGLNSSYDAQWTGPFVGLGLDASTHNKTEIRVELMYHPDLDYHADADWNLRADLQHPVSYTHDADGRGVNFKFTISQYWTKSLNVYLDYQRFVYSAEDGLDVTYISNGTTASTKLNEANWDASLFTLGLVLRLW